MDATPPPAPSLAADRRGATIVEFALVLPLLVCLLLGILGYGRYFLLAHSVQQVANDAARATVAGLTDTERETLADQAVADDTAALGEFAQSPVTTSVTQTGDTVTVAVSLDATGTQLFRTALVPMPSPIIKRRAVVRPGGLT